MEKNRLDRNRGRCHHSNMLEVEMKFAVAGFEGLLGHLRAAGAGPAAIHGEADQYFNAPDRDFARTDEALRIRRVGDKSFVTYKGPKRDAQTKTRTEIEVPLAAGAVAADDLARLLTCLGYRPVAVVRKQRRTFHLVRDGFSLEVCLDEVEKVGQYVELEILTPEERLEQARALLLKLAADWGLSGSERRSYLELLLQETLNESP